MCAKTMSPPEKPTGKSATAGQHVLRSGERVLLVGGSEFRQNIRASILRAHGLQVETARTLSEASSFCKARTYNWLLLDVHQQFPGEVIHLCQEIKQVAPGQRIAFFVGPPAYISLKWPGEEITDREQREHAAEFEAAA